MLKSRRGSIIGIYISQVRLGRTSRKGNPVNGEMVVHKTIDYEVYITLFILMYPDISRFDCFMGEYIQYQTVVYT